MNIDGSFNMPLSSVIALTIYVCLVMHFEDVPKSEKVEDKCQEKKNCLNGSQDKDIGRRYTVGAYDVL